MANRESTVGSKWVKTKVLLLNKELSEFVPETRIYSQTNLLHMLKKHTMVYVKPINGSFGQGVIRVEKNDKYRFQSGKVSRSFRTFLDLYTALNKAKLNRPYLVQQGIHLLTHQNRIFDTRIMVQKSPKKTWEATGYIGRVAHPNKIVTNFHNSGKPLPLELLLGSYLKKQEKHDYINSLRHLGYKIATHYQKSYPGFKEIGVDIGIDKKLKPWVLEVNTAPDPFIFNQLKDKKMFFKVLHYARVNGRFLSIKRK
ncbi:YheC/YheD family protein [Paenibacillus macquariensis]|uniref:YheC/D like ATP-grasp n=1 Tax=Paenibacillus macquariensis TaxID=948756 RepID=A0ABY1JPS6_9BACL|nr:YheC/YheD family protein [Paenibacillus macquariensis]MEC0094062.1 YheC/YheD family protein [Paenibacillus macquariensis]OAB37525.1 endospore coat-associated protein [Paenibacillus macquariensis subsp. macquariensis]SIQ55521.1 YheC/D like ATP-grasp [Paenibacillus macquariensis]